MLTQHTTAYSFELTNKFIVLIAITCGFTVANVYFNQTLLVSMANTFHVSETKIGIVATLTQVGYALGNLVLVPLGDIVERKKLILSLLSISCIPLALAAFATNVLWLIIANLVLGFVTIIPQIIIPFTASLATNDNRGKVLGNVSIGLVCGILGARLISGFIDSQLGWRAMYAISLLNTFILILLIRMYFPKGNAVHSVQYKKLIQSFLPLFLQERSLQRACLSQGMMFGAFSAFWTSLVFLLSTPPYHYGSSTTGFIGLVGIAGAFATPMIGRVIDKKGTTFASVLCIIISLVAFCLFLFLGYWLPGLVIGALLITVGTQANQVACQAHIFQSNPEKSSSLNGLYMVSTFLGGAAGSYFGMIAWNRWKWYGVCTIGLIMISMALMSLIQIPKLKIKKGRHM